MKAERERDRPERANQPTDGKKRFEFHCIKDFTNWTTVRQRCGFFGPFTARLSI